MGKNDRKLSFLYVIRNSCNKIWTETDMTDERIQMLKDNGCSIKSVAMGKKIYKPIKH